MAARRQSRTIVNSQEYDLKRSLALAAEVPGRGGVSPPSRPQVAKEWRARDPLSQELDENEIARRQEGVRGDIGEVDRQARAARQVGEGTGPGVVVDVGERAEQRARQHDLVDAMGEADDLAVGVERREDELVVA